MRSLGLLVLPLLLWAGAASGQIASWDNTTLNVNTSVNAAVGTGTISRGPGVAFRNFAGTYSTDEWQQSSQASAVTNGDYVQLTVDTTGRTDIVLQFIDNRNGTGPGNARIFHSATGTAGPFTAADTFTPATTAGSMRVFDYSGVTALHNNANVVFRIYAWGNALPNGFLRFSNIAVGNFPAVTDVTATDERTIVVTFGRPMGASALNPANYTASGTGLGTLAAQPDGVVSLSSTMYELSWLAPQEMFGGGSVTVTVNTAVTDAAGFSLGSPNFGTTTAIGVAPSITSIIVFGPDPTNATDVDFQVTFDEGVLGIEQVAPFGNFTANVVGGTLAGVAVTDVMGSGAVYDVAVTAGAGDGTVRLDLTAAGAIADLAGNAFVAPFTGGASVRIDHIAPTVAFITPQSGSTIDITFSEDVDAFALTQANYTLSGAGMGSLAATPDVAALVSGQTYQLTWLTGSSIAGQLITVTASNAIADLATNPIVPGSGDSASAIALPVVLSTFMLE